jgi:hypothetical protein
VQGAFTNAFNTGGAAAFITLISNLATVSLLTQPQIVGQEGINALNGLNTALANLTS